MRTMPRETIPLTREQYAAVTSLVAMNADILPEVYLPYLSSAAYARKNQEHFYKSLNKIYANLSEYNQDASYSAIIFSPWKSAGILGIEGECARHFLTSNLSQTQVRDVLFDAFTSYIYYQLAQNPNLRLQMPVWWNKENLPAIQATHSDKASELRRYTNYVTHYKNRAFYGAIAVAASVTATFVAHLAYSPVVEEREHRAEVTHIGWLYTIVPALFITYTILHQTSLANAERGLSNLTNVIPGNNAVNIVTRTVSEWKEIFLIDDHITVLFRDSADEIKTHANRWMATALDHYTANQPYQSPLVCDASKILIDLFTEHCLARIATKCPSLRENQAFADYSKAQIAVHVGKMVADVERDNKWAIEKKGATIAAQLESTQRQSWAQVAVGRADPAAGFSVAL
jgi:hypothetical protein